MREQETSEEMKKRQNQQLTHFYSTLSKQKVKQRAHRFDFTISIFFAKVNQSRASWSKSQRIIGCISNWPHN